MELLKTLIVSSEKAANIARLLRSNDILFKMLVEEKSSHEANPKFNQDFKTLADVLIQEMVKYDVGSKFPALHTQVRGEESNHFYSHDLMKDVNIEVNGNQEDTTNLLEEIVNDTDIAKMLTEEVYKQIKIETINTILPDIDIKVDIDTLSVWIDPIDGTNEYVKGKYSEKQGDFYLEGLTCVTVLIGVISENGECIMGIINQPFFEKNENKGQCLWGVCLPQGDEIFRASSCTDQSLPETNTICIGGGESELITKMLMENGYNLIVTKGAGYKLLTVVLGLADAYLLSKPTTFFWDTCGPQAILKSLGGDIMTINSLISKQVRPILYKSDSSSSNCNSDGIVAFRNIHVFEKLLKLEWTKI